MLKSIKKNKKKNLCNPMRGSKELFYSPTDPGVWHIRIKFWLERPNLCSTQLHSSVLWGGEERKKKA